MELSKEQILGNNDITDRSLYYSRAKIAMDEYAEQQSIEFETFKINNKYHYHYAAKLYVKGRYDDLEAVKEDGITLAELYQIFLKEKNNV